MIIDPIASYPAMRKQTHGFSPNDWLLYDEPKKTRTVNVSPVEGTRWVELPKDVCYDITHGDPNIYDTLSYVGTMTYYRRSKRVVVKFKKDIELKIVDPAQTRDPSG
jgi:hypothetical protein